MGIFKPWLGQGYVMRLEPSRKVATIMGVIVMAVALGGLVALRERRLSPPPTDPLATPPSFFTALTWFATVFLLLGFVSAIVNGRRWRLNRTIVRMSNSREGLALRPRTEWTVESARAARIPPLAIAPGWTARRHSPSRLSRVTSTSNVIGQPPMRLAYLRIFDNQPRARTFLQSAWREFGHVYLLRSASSVAPRELRKLRRSGIEQMFVQTRDDLERALAATNTSPGRRGRRAFRHLAPTTVRAYDRHGAYPPVAILCHGSYWRDAVDELLLHVEAVCLDLSGFRPKHEGTGYELQRVVDRFPIERVVFLADPKSRLSYLQSAIQTAWTQMAADSPNEGTQPRTTHLAITDRLQITIQRNEHGQETGRQVRLIANRRRSRRVAAGLQRSLATAPPVPRRAWGHTALSPAPVPEVNRQARAPSWSPTGWVSVMVLTLVAGAGMALAAPGLVPGAYTTVAADEYVTVPNVVGMRVGRANRILHRAGLEVTTSPVEDSASANTVVHQEPPSGSSVPDGNMVWLFVSTGSEGPTHPQTTTVPDVIHMTTGEAADELEIAGLQWQVVDERESRFQEGTVLETDPPANEIVPKGETVELVVASGWNWVPDVVGSSVDEAEAELFGAGFEVNVTNQPDEAEPGTVIEQFPFDDRAELGSTVVLTVAEAPVTETPTPTESPTPTPTPTESPSSPVLTP